MRKNKGKIITLTSTKGGIGKTITVLNLAAIYNMLGFKVLVVDFDLYKGVIATYINSQNEKTIFNLVDDFIHNRYEDIANYVHHYNNNIDVIAAPKDPRMANKIDSKYIPLILNNVIYKYDIILIDTSSNLDETTIVTMDNSDKILYVFTNDIFDLKNTRSFFSIVQDAGIENIYTLLNEARNPGRNYFSMYDIRNIIKHNVDFTISKGMYIKNIDKYILEGEILLLNNKLGLKGKSDYKSMINLAKTLLNEGEAKK